MRRCRPRSTRTSHEAYRDVADGSPAATWAVRSSATAEDLPEASFAGQQETFLNINGLDNILHAVKEVFASLYNDRAIAYRVHQGFAHADVALSAGVQRMVRSDLGASGVMFTLDTESGFDQVVFITASYGLGETVVQGAVNPDEFYVYKPNLAAGAAGDPAQDARREGGADGLRRRANARAARPSPSTSPTRTATASRSPTPRRTSSRATRSPSKSTTAARWTSNGAATARTASSTSCRRGRRR